MKHAVFVFLGMALLCLALFVAYNAIDTTSLNETRTLAEQGDAKAQFNLGICMTVA